MKENAKVQKPIALSRSQLIRFQFALGLTVKLLADP